MTDKNQHGPNKNPREIPTKEDPGKIGPNKATDLKPDKNNPINPETDEPNAPSKNQKNDSKIKNPIQDNPGKQITS